jgi:hypothetical protein
MLVRRRGRCFQFLHTPPKNYGQDFALSQEKCNHASILLTNILKLQTMLWCPRWNAPTTAAGEFEKCRACVLRVIAPEPVRHALSNSRRAGSTKTVTCAQCRNMKVDATVAQIQCIDDGGRRCWLGRCGGNARNRVCRLTTDMRITQGQDAFGHNVQTIIIIYSYMVKTF